MTDVELLVSFSALWSLFGLNLDVQFGDDEMMISPALS